jgi:exopolysaccharide biosynthesis polyprenyl glycosylphosphotransferase
VSLQAGHGIRLRRDVEHQQTWFWTRRIAPRFLLPTFLVLADIIAICSAFGFAYLVRFRSNWSVFYANSETSLTFYSTLVFLLAPVIVVVFALYRLYSRRQIFDGPGEYQRIASAATFSALLTVLLSFLLDSELVVSRGWLLIAWISMIAFVSASRFAVRRAMYALRRRGFFNNRVAIVASGSDLQRLVDQFQTSDATGLNIVARVTPDDISTGAGSERQNSYMRSLIDAHYVDEVIVSSASVPQPALAGIVRDLAQTRTVLHIIPGMYEIQTTGVQARDVQGIPLVMLNKVRITGLDYFLKRSLDYAIAGTMLMLMSPVLLTIALLVRLTSPGPILHRREVIGERGEPFDAFKFRTMFVDCDTILDQHPGLRERLQREGKLVDDPRVTPVGRWLRRWSLDEFPQLLNVLGGQMSLVGPRMITAAELEHFGHWRDNLITVKPGITGLWQVSGRSNLGYDDRVRLDMFYIRSYSIWRDLEILIRTVPAVWRGTGAY